MTTMEMCYSFSDEEAINLFTFISVNNHYQSSDSTFLKTEDRINDNNVLIFVMTTH